MGIVNVTPDSFSDGGLFLDAGAAIAHGRRLAGEAAETDFPDEAPSAPAETDSPKPRTEPKPRPFPLPGATMQPPPEPEGAN